MAGYASAPHLLVLWVLYSSFVNAGQLFYGYGWEILTLETGFLAVFLCPFGRGGRRHAVAPDRAVVWLLRWLLFRVMFGAGLIKLRGDPCWLDLTCLFHHYETQPIPNPLSPYLHLLPAWRTAPACSSATSWRSAPPCCSSARCACAGSRGSSSSPSRCCSSPAATSPGSTT